MSEKEEKDIDSLEEDGKESVAPVRRRQKRTAVLPAGWERHEVSLAVNFAATSKPDVCCLKLICIFIT